MELRNKEELRSEILQNWLRSAWVYPFEGPDERTYLRLTPGGRLKMRRRIGELERALGVSGTELARQEEAGTIPIERDRLELAMMVRAYHTERRLIQSQAGDPRGDPGGPGGRSRSGHDLLIRWARCCAPAREVIPPLVARVLQIQRQGGVLTLVVLGFPGAARPGQGERSPAKTREGGPL
jgi:hypothetical protein